MSNFRMILPIRISAFLLIIVLIVSCKKDDNNFPNENGSMLTGTWLETIMAQPGSCYTNQLTFNIDSTFSSKTSSYGIYSGQGQNDLSGWFEFVGKYTRDGDSLDFISHKVTSWDSFYGGQPQTQLTDQQLFDNCRFTIHDQILEITYITYPADAPEKTQRQYKKVSK